MKQFFIFLIMLLLIIYLANEKFNPKPLKQIRIIDTLIVYDTVKTPPIIKYIKVEAKPLPQNIADKVDSLLLVSNDSLKKVLEYISAPVETTFYLQPSGWLHIDYLPLERYLTSEVQLPERINKMIRVRDSIFVPTQDYNLVMYGSVIGLLVGLLFGLAI